MPYGRRNRAIIPGNDASMRPISLLALLLFLTVVLAPIGAVFDRLARPPAVTHSVQSRILRLAPATRARLLPYFQRAGVSYPPTAVTLVGLKQERRLLLFAAGPDQEPRYVRGYDIVGASGTLGPKTREGDRQVPEGLYAAELLNPNSVAYLSIRVGYPNRFDRRMAEVDGRSELGGDIMIHGATEGSRGCIAVSDQAIEELFTLVADSGLKQTRIIISPVDFRFRSLPDAGRRPAWTGALYARLARALTALPTPLETWRLTLGETVLHRPVRDSVR